MHEPMHVETMETNSGLSTFISKFADDTKIRNSSTTAASDRMSLQEDLRKVLKWSEKWKMPFNINKCHILRIGAEHQKFEYERNGVNSKAYTAFRILAS